MTDINSAMEFSVAALNAHAWGMAVTVHNIANINTAGFVPRRAVYATGPDGYGVNLYSVDKDLSANGSLAGQAPLPSSDGGEISREMLPSGVELSREIARMISDESGFRANASAIGSICDMADSLLDLKV